MTDYTKILDEIKESPFSIVKKDINKSVWVSFEMNYREAEYGRGDMIVACVVKKFKKGRFMTVMTLAPEIFDTVEMDWDKYFINEIQTGYKNRDKTKDPK
jgi:hypothetical protein